MFFLSVILGEWLEAAERGDEPPDDVTAARLESDGGVEDDNDDDDNDDDGDETAVKEEFGETERLPLCVPLESVELKGRCTPSEVWERTCDLISGRGEIMVLSFVPALLLLPCPSLSLTTCGDDRGKNKTRSESRISDQDSNR